MDKARKHPACSNIDFCTNPYEAAEGSDAIIVVTEWREFNHLDFIKIKSVMRNNIFIDGRNMYDPSRMKKMGFTYSGIGRQ